MARTLSWIDRIVPIARTISESACSHYDRRDLQRLFEIQPRSAQNLMAAMPILSIGKSHLVEKEALQTLLQLLNEAENPTRTFALLRSKKLRRLQRKLRTLSLSDVSAEMDLLPENLTLNPGEITIRFETVDQLAEVMVYLAVLLQDHLDDFASRYECRPSLPHGDGSQEQEACSDANYIDRWPENTEPDI